MLHSCEKFYACQVVVVHAFNPSAQEAQTGGSVSFRPDWSTEQVLGQVPKLHREILSQKTKQNKVLHTTAINLEMMILS